MKIVVYGISCAGKDTFINQFVANNMIYTHIRGSESLNILAKNKYNILFRDLDTKKQNDLRKEFVSSIKAVENIIVDGHYCFPENNAYKTVFTTEDENLYDIFIYLRVKPQDAHERIGKSEKNNKYKYLTVENIENWQSKEISELRDICFRAHKEFIVLDEDFELDLQFMSLYLSNFPKMTAIEIAKIIVEKIKNQSITSRKVALFDCDRTVTAEDTTIPFFDINNGDKNLLKEIFRGDVYSEYQFWRQQELYKDFIKYPDFKDFNFNKCILNKLDSLRNEGYTIYGLTAGIYCIWEEINNEKKLFSEVIGNDLTNNSVGIITDYVKGYVVELLKEDNYTVFSTGDSMCDIHMLEMAGGYIWAPGKTRPMIQDYINTHAETTIKQYKDNINKYKGISEVA